MFAGIVEALQPVTRIESRPPGIRLMVDGGDLAQATEIGHSISINGCCLTVVDVAGSQLGFDAGSETLSRTNLGKLVEGSRVNLERSLVVGDRLGGHFVTGHIDCKGKINAIKEIGLSLEIAVQFPNEYSGHLVKKGSIAVNGISLTVNKIEGTIFTVNVIPYTKQRTSVGRFRPGAEVNLEFDILAKYVASLMSKGNNNKSFLSKLEKSGW